MNESKHTADINWFEDKAQWKGLKSAGMVESVRRLKGETSIERRYYLSSLECGAKEFGRAVRKHWGVENPLHWTLDVTFDEDQRRARTKFAAQNPATLRRIALGLLNKDKTRKRSTRRKRKLAALDEQYRMAILRI